MFRAFSCPSSGAYQLQQQQPLFYRRNVVVVVYWSWSVRLWGTDRTGPDRTDYDQQHCYHHLPTVNQGLLLQLIGS